MALAVGYLEIVIASIQRGEDYAQAHCEAAFAKKAFAEIHEDGKMLRMMLRAGGGFVPRYKRI